MGRMRRGVARFTLPIGLAILAAAIPLAAHADLLYGQNNYTDCQYSNACPTPTPTPKAGGGTSGGSSGSGTTSSPGPAPTPDTTTVGELPSGLQYAINVTDGQSIPFGGYDVVVTPLNGAGSTFVKVDFLLDDVFQASPAAAATGTFYWHWDTKAKRASRLTVKIYGPNAEIDIRNFRVRIAAAKFVPETTTSSPLERAVKQIPTPIIYGFPYLLFILLAIAILILVWQVRREIAESERLQALLAKEKILATEKTTFIQVASHYLRTPLTLINGGLDLATSDPALAQGLAGLRSRIQALAGQVETLLGEIIHRAESATPAVAPEINPVTRIWLRPAFIIPIGLIAILTTGFNLLVTRIGQFELPAIDLFIQAAIFLILSLIFYFALRNFFLRHRELTATRQLQAEHLAIDTSRNQLIHDAAEKLGATMQGIFAETNPILAASSTALDTLKTGLARFTTMLVTFATAEQIRTGKLSAAPANFHLTGLANAAFAASADPATAKHLKIVSPDEDAILSCLDPALFQRVITSLINNAVAYSPAGGQVALTIEGGMQSTRFTISDQGPGLSPGQIKQLFQPFFRAEGALDFTHEGMGFSLYLDKLIMTFLGGDIRIEPGATPGLVVKINLPV